MAEYPSHPPTVATIELDRRCIRLNDAKMQYFIAASDYFSLTLGEQTLANPISPAFAGAPINHPAILRLSEPLR